MEYVAKFIKNGNTKIGRTMWTWNKLAGSGEIGGCKGTCGKHCAGCYNSENPQKSPCYVFKSYVLYGWENSTVVKSHIRNTNIIRSDIERAFNEIQLQLKRAKKKPSAVRLHSSGELETIEELENWIETAEMNKNIPFYIYTKSYEIVDEVLSSMDEEDIPDNFFINISVWHEEGIELYNKWKHLKCVRCFVYDDGYDYGDRIKIDCHCPAYRMNDKGKVILKHDITCDVCKLCLKETNKVVACLDH